jgi:hypothetical protein
MDKEIVVLFCLCDDFLECIGHHEDRQCGMSDAEVLTTALVSALYFGCNYERARSLLLGPQYIPKMLSKSRFNRRLHRISHLLEILFSMLAETWKGLNTGNSYSLDTFPVPICDNIRISRARIYESEDFRGYIASKRRYFYGVKVHLLVTETGQPVEFFLTPGATADVSGLQAFHFDLPAGSILVGDKAYNHYVIEDLLAEAGIQFLPFRKQNSKRQLPPWWRYLQQRYRKRVETAASLIERRLPKHIHAVSAAGFELKVTLFVLALSLSHLL